MVNIDRIDNLPFGRAYHVHGKGINQFLPSVTTVLQMRKEQWLIDLEETIGTPKFIEITNRGARRGTVMHNYLEQFVIHYGKHKNAEEALLYAQRVVPTFEEFKDWDTWYPKAMKTGRNLFYNFYNQKFWEEIAEVLHSEVFLWTTFKGGWAGTADFVWRDTKGRLVMEDFKSSSYFKDISKIDGYRIQISVYMFQYAERYGEIPQRGRIRIANGEDNQLQVIEVLDTEFKKYVRMFIELMYEFRQLDTWKEFIDSKQSIITNI